MIDAPSPNCEPRPDGAEIDMLVLHYTGMETAAAALAHMRDPTAKVSAHYMIDEDGAVTRLVADDMRAWHAGVSSWAGASDINDRSIGIELVNPGHEFGYRAFPEAQMASLIPLCQAIVARHGIAPERVIGHSDVAPLRKEDPGERFDWRRLAAAGIGLWPEDIPKLQQVPSEATLRAQLARFGYDLEEVPLSPVITAFQRHFRQEQVNGIPDLETASRLAALLRLLGPAHT